MHVFINITYLISNLVYSNATSVISKQYGFANFYTWDKLVWDIPIWTRPT